MDSKTIDAIENMTVGVELVDGSTAYVETFSDFLDNVIVLTETVPVSGELILTFFLKDSTTSFILKSVLHFCKEPASKIFYKIK